MKMSDVKRRNRIIGVCLAVASVYATGLDGTLRQMGGPALMLICLVPLFILVPLLIEWLERKIVG